jgi:hypothetical protein
MNKKKWEIKSFFISFMSDSEKYWVIGMYIVLCVSGSCPFSVNNKYSKKKKRFKNKNITTIIL